MPKYRKKPVIIEAEQIPYVDDIDARILFEEWAEYHNIAKSLKWSGSNLKLQTLEGEMTAEEGDYVIIGVKGEVYSCKEEIFLMTYEDLTGISTAIPGAWL